MGSASFGIRCTAVESARNAIQSLVGINNSPYCGRNLAMASVEHRPIERAKQLQGKVLAGWRALLGSGVVRGNWTDRAVARPL